MMPTGALFQRSSSRSVLRRVCARCRLPRGLFAAVFPRVRCWETMRLANPYKN